MGAGEAVVMTTVLVISVVTGLLILAALAFWLWMLVDCAMNESDEGNIRLIWVLIIIFVHFIGAILYFFFQRRKRLGQAGGAGAAAPPPSNPA